MATPGLLTRSGMLYEGNYTSWAKRMEAILEMHDIEAYTNEKGNLCIFNGDLTTAELPKTTTLITNLISKGILGRISDSRKDDPEALAHSLRALAKPFRLNDLPPELRGRIYSIWFKSARRHTYTFFKSKSISSPKPPSMLLVSRATRLEALPLFYRSSEFQLHFTRSQGEKFDGRATYPVAMMRRWAEVGVKAGVRDLRRLCVRRQYRHPVVVVTLDVNKNKGLAVNFEEKDAVRLFTSEQKESWKKHIEQVEADRQALGLLGKALILAFTSKPELWETPG
ncbi:hypothetical protein LTR15_006212 [Elasticomyces elasticus]|nr:hypothetical protein LTR15_006212 [Elasticomyces elasticus]